MMRLLKTRQAQANIGEYVLLIFIATAAVTAMSIYVKRALQGRVRDATVVMAKTPLKYLTSDGNVFQYNGIMYLAYEPYYENRLAVIEQQTNDTSTLSQGMSSGVFKKNIDQRTYVETYSEQLAPKDAK